MLIAQISDLHITADARAVAGVVNTNRLAERAIEALLRHMPRPDFVIVTGDLVETGTPEEYEVVREILARLPMPVYAVPGNHDRRDVMRAAFAGGGYLPAQGPLDFMIESRPVRLIGLDSLVEGHGHGALSGDTLTFLARALSSHPETPAIVALHHPPLACGIDHMDRIRLRDGAQELERILSFHPQVQRLITGHVHRPVQARFGGTICQIAPSVAHQVTLDLTTDAPASLTLEPPAFLLHTWDDTTGLVTHTAYIDPGAGPFPF